MTIFLFTLRYLSKIWGRVTANTVVIGKAIAAPSISLQEKRRKEQKENGGEKNCTPWQGLKLGIRPVEISPKYSISS